MPLVQVQDGTATVGVAVRSASSLDGPWVALKPTTFRLGEAGTVHLTFQASEGAAFYKFVVPEGLHAASAP